MDRTLRKITSARWLIVVITLNTEFITIYTMIIAFYFSKDRKEVSN
ncbi:hypothetical protein [Clostridium sporogenes]|nr:hypothetical protein [Clostridium sporogenes]MCW6112295.1 hypothetical protein [Clostridium sporogenes]